MKSSVHFCLIFLIFVSVGSLRADREVRIQMRVPAGVHHLEIEWIADKDAPPSVPDVVNSGEVRRMIADGIHFFRVRSVDPEGHPGPWSSLYPVDKFARNAVAGARALVTSDRFQLEIKPDGAGWQLRMIRPSDGVTFRSGAALVMGITYTLGSSSSVALLFPGETVPFAVLIALSEGGGAGLRFVTPLGVRVEMTRGIRISVVHPGVPLK